MICNRPGTGRTGTIIPRAAQKTVARIFHELPGREVRRAGSAGFQACCIADFQVGRLFPASGARRVWKPAIQSRFGIGTLRTACEICGVAASRKPASAEATPARSARHSALRGGGSVADLDPSRKSELNSHVSMKRFVTFSSLSGAGRCPLAPVARQAEAWTHLFSGTAHRPVMNSQTRQLASYLPPGFFLTFPVYASECARFHVCRPRPAAQMRTVGVGNGSGKELWIGIRGIARCRAFGINVPDRSALPRLSVLAALQSHLLPLWPSIPQPVSARWASCAPRGRVPHKTRRSTHHELCEKELMK
jgi:hypothetical protein